MDFHCCLGFIVNYDKDRSLRRMIVYDPTRTTRLLLFHPHNEVGNHEFAPSRYALTLFSSALVNRRTVEMTFKSCLASAVPVVMYLMMTFFKYMKFTSKWSGYCVSSPTLSGGAAGEPKPPGAANDAKLGIADTFG